MRNEIREVYVVLRRLLSFVLILTLICGAFSAVNGVAEEEEVYSGYRTLKRGDRDGDDSVSIVQLQNRLIQLGYLRDQADGVYGANTETAVAALQRANDLEETGIATPEFLEFLYSGADVVAMVNSTDGKSVVYRTQYWLGTWGFMEDDADGVNGSKTKEAIVDFKTYLQGYLILHPTPRPEESATPAPSESTGYGDAQIAVDVPIQREAMDADISEDVLAFINQDYEFDVYRKTVASGDTGDEVKRVQRRLHQLRYLAVVDGTFGDTTERALLYFQKKNNLSQTAVADEATQRLLFSESAQRSEEYVNNYKIIVDVSDQRVYVYQWNGSSYGIYVGEMICSTGMKGAETETPLGTFQAWGPTGTGEWYWFKDFECYAKWGTRIVGGILFHSVIYSKGKVLNKTSVQKLGRRASHGCIRLKVEHAKWIYENCTPGTTVVIQE